MRWRAACVDILRALSNAQPNRALNGNDRADRGRVAVAVTAPRIPDTRPVERVGRTDAPSWGGLTTSWLPRRATPQRRSDRVRLAEVVALTVVDAKIVEQLDRVLVSYLFGDCSGDAPLRDFHSWLDDQPVSSVGGDVGDEVALDL